MTDKETLEAAKAQEKPFTLEQKLEKITIEVKNATQEVDFWSAVTIKLTGKAELLQEMIDEQGKAAK